MILSPFDAYQYCLRCQGRHLMYSAISTKGGGGVSFCVYPFSSLDNVALPKKELFLMKGNNLFSMKNSLAFKS